MVYGAQETERKILLLASKKWILTDWMNGLPREVYDSIGVAEGEESEVDHERKREGFARDLRADYDLGEFTELVAICERHGTRASGLTLISSRGLTSFLRATGWQQMGCWKRDPMSQDLRKEGDMGSCGSSGECSWWMYLEKSLL